MTQAELVQYYADLLIMQYSEQPKAVATIKLVTGLVIMNLLPFEVENAFDLDQSTGYQLDMVGKYQGVKRTSYTFTRQITLNDADFRTLIQLAIIKNNGGSSLYDIQELVNGYFNAQLQVFDYGNMRMSYYLSNSIASTDLAEIFIVQGLLPKPMGVTLSSTIRYPVLDQFFGYSTYGGGVNPFNNPYNTYDEYEETWPWVSYQYQIGRTNSLVSFLSTEIANVKLDQEDSGHIIA